MHSKDHNSLSFIFWSREEEELPFGMLLLFGILLRSWIFVQLFKILNMQNKVVLFFFPEKSPKSSATCLTCLRIYSIWKLRGYTISPCASFLQELCNMRMLPEIEDEIWKTKCYFCLFKEKSGDSNEIF